MGAADAAFKARLASPAGSAAAAATAPAPAAAGGGGSSTARGLPPRSPSPTRRAGTASGGASDGASGAASGGGEPLTADTSFAPLSAALMRATPPASPRPLSLTEMLGPSLASPPRGLLSPEAAEELQLIPTPRGGGGSSRRASLGGASAAADTPRGAAPSSAADTPRGALAQAAPGPLTAARTSLGGGSSQSVSPQRGATPPLMEPPTGAAPAPAAPPAPAPVVDDDDGFYEVEELPDAGNAVRAFGAAAPPSARH